MALEQKLELSTKRDEALNKKLLDELLIDYNLEELEVSYDELLSAIPNIGRNLKDFCELKKISQTDLAKSLKISRKTIVRYISGKIYNTNILKLAAEILNISIIELILGIQLGQRLELAKEILNIIPNIGQNIKEMCLAKNISYNQLARKININLCTFSNYLCGKRKINIYVLQSIAGALNTTVEKILFKNIDIRANLKLFCLLKGITFTELFDMAQIPITSISYILNTVYLQKAISVLGISFEQLILSVNSNILLDAQNIGKNLRNILELKNISYVELASITLLNITTIYNIVNGQCYSAYSLRCIAHALNISIADIVFSSSLPQVA